jgi:hypothetical protein
LAFGAWAPHVVWGWQTERHAATGFSNPPLHYDGPDPTAGFFLPTARPWTPSELRPAHETPTSAVSPVISGTGGPPLLTGPGWNEEIVPGILDPLNGVPCAATGVTDFKDGFFQKLGMTWTWIDRRQDDDYGLNEVDSFVTVAIPAPTREWPMLISPTFNVRWIDGPVTPDLPGLARFDWIPDRLQLLFGVLYLNRNDVQLLPAGGLIWTPNDAKRYEILFPKPKLAHRITVGPHYEDWVYLGAEFGGNTYAVERVGGAADFITLRDIRTYVGLERKKNGGAGFRIEAGYVFARRVEYDSATPDIEADGTAVLRGGFTF